MYDLQVFGIEAIQKAAYRFIDRMAVNFCLVNAQVRCELLFDSEVPNLTTWSVISRKKCWTNICDRESLAKPNRSGI